MKTFRQKIIGAAEKPAISDGTTRLARWKRTRTSKEGEMHEPCGTLVKYFSRSAGGRLRKERSRKMPRLAFSRAVLLASLATISMGARSNHPASCKAMAIVKGSSPVAQAALQMRKVEEVRANH